MKNVNFEPLSHEEMNQIKGGKGRLSDILGDAAEGGAKGVGSRDGGTWHPMPI